MFFLVMRFFRFRIFLARILFPLVTGINAANASQIYNILEERKMLLPLEEQTKSLINVNYVVKVATQLFSLLACMILFFNSFPEE